MYCSPSLSKVETLCIIFAAILYTSVSSWLYTEMTETLFKVCFQAFSGHRGGKLSSNYDVIMST